MQIESYLNDRVQDQVDYYSRKSKLNKQFYFVFKISQLVAAAILPFFTLFLTGPGVMKYVVAAIGTLITILEGILAVGKYHEKWVIYRSTAESMLQEKFMFLMKAGIYTQPDAVIQFVSRIEFLLGKENAGWQQMIVKDNQPKEENATDSQTQNASADEGAKADDAQGSTANTSATQTNEEGSAEHLPIDPITGVKADIEDSPETDEVTR